MASFTAYMMVGGSHPNHGGVTGETVVYLSENGRPALVFGLPEEDGGLPQRLSKVLFALAQ